MSKTKVLSNKETKETKESKDTRCPVFRLKPDKRSNSATIKYVGYYNEGEKLGDEIIELDRQYKSDEPIGRNAIPLKKIGSFSVTARLYKCNIVGSHIIVSKRYPLLYLDIGYEKTLVTGSLFQIFLSLDMNRDDKKEIKDNKQYVNLKVKGIWRRHLDCDDELTENYEKFLVEMLEEDGLDTLYKSTDSNMIEKRSSMNETDVVEWVDNYVKEERKFYDSLIQEQEVRFMSIPRARDELVQLCTSDKFNKFVALAMRCRDIHRRKEHGLDETPFFVVPKEEDIVKLDDISNELMKNCEIVFDDE